MKIAFNDGWTVEGPEGTSRQVTLPHDAMIHRRRTRHAESGPASGYYPSGAYVYRTTLAAPESWRTAHVSLVFEGVYRHAEVRLNGALIGARPSGFAEFSVELEDHLVYGGANEIEVTARSAPGDTRWYSGAGIYRRVWLTVEGATRFAHDGVRFRTVSATAESAQVSVEVTALDDSDRPIEVDVELRRGGVAVSTASSTLRSGVPAAVGLAVTAPALWSAHSPELYDLVVRTRGQSSPVEHVERVGIRTLSADSRRGLLVNGVPTLLRGGCLHHDNGVLGVATFRDAEFRRVRLLKEIGFNAIRSGHTPISRELLEACDEIGMFVMDELTDVWFKPKGRGDYGNQFTAWWRRDLESMIAKDRNHASVIFYSIGNENGETATDEGIAVGREMVEFCHRADETRLVTAGINPFLNALASVGVGLLNMGGEAESDDPVERARTEAAARAKKPKKPKKQATVDDPPKMANSTLINHLMNTLNDRILTRPRLPRFDSSTRGIFAELDVAGYNYGVGQYELHARRHPDRVMVGTETNPKDIVRNWNLVEKNPFLIGDFMWTATDYLGEAGIGSWTYGAERTGLIKPFPWLTADCGAVDLVGNVTAAGLLARAAWGRVEPAIVSRPPMRVGEKTVTSNWRGTDALATWSWSGWEGKPTEVEVYTAAAEVELLLNERSLGRRPAGSEHGCTAIFPTPFEPGELVAIAYGRGGREVGRTTLTSASGELTLRLRTEQTTLTAGEQDLAFVTAELVDASGIVAPVSGVALTAHVDGAATLAGFGSADPRPPYGFTGGFHATFHGSALAVVRAGAEAGIATLRVAADGYGEQELSLPISAPADSN